MRHRNNLARAGNLAREGNLARAWTGARGKFGVRGNFGYKKRRTNALELATKLATPLLLSYSLASTRTTASLARSRAMAPRTNSTGFTGMRSRPNRTFYAEIRAGGQRLILGTFPTADQAARAYDAAA